MIHARIQEFPSGGGGGGGGVQGHLAYEKSSDNVFIFFSPQLISQKSGCYFQRKLLFATVPVGVQHFPGGGVQLFTGGPIVFPYRNLYNLCFSRGGGGPDPLPPPSLWIRPCDSAHCGLIYLLVFLLSFSTYSLITYSANSFVERGENIASAAVLPVV